MRQINNQLILLSLIFTKLVIFQSVKCQEVVCQQQSDCRQNECCNQGTCQLISDGSLRQYCTDQKKCYAQQCQYGCCTNNQQCGSYSDCSSGQQYQVQIIISIVVGSIVFVLLICYIFAVCKKRKRSQVMDGEEENDSNIQRNDRTMINQTNPNQTQLMILNNNANQTSLTEQNVNALSNQRNNLDKSIQKPTHVLPPIQTIFLIDQNKDQPIFVQKKLDMNDIESINHSIQGTRVSKEYFMRKKKNRLSQRVNSQSQSNALQQSVIEQRRQYEGDGQVVSFNRIDQQNFSQIDNNEFNLQRLETNQSQQVNKQDDLLKNPDNYLYQILRQLRQQVYVKKRGQTNNQRQSRQMYSESDLSQQSNLQRKKIQSLHNENISANKNFESLIQEVNRKQQSEQNIFQNEGQKQQNNNIFIKNKPPTQDDVRGNEQEIMLNREQTNERYKNTYKINIQRNLDEEEFSNAQQNIFSNQRNIKNDRTIFNSNDILESINTQQQQENLQTPHMENPITPHANQDNTQRQLNPKNVPNQPEELNSRSSINSNNLIQILQNQINEDYPINQQDKKSKSRNSKNNLEVPTAFNNRNIKERKSQSNNDEDLVKTINKIYQNQNEDSIIENQNLKHSTEKSEYQIFKMQDLLNLEQQKSQTISDSIYELERQIDNINSQKKREESFNKSNQDDYNLDNHYEQSEQQQQTKGNSNNNNLEIQHLNFTETKHERNSRNSITQLPRILTLSQFQQN
ncbi:hypothetical protein ABPG74_005901 [Tetrahymena malaccensis]